MTEALAVHPCAHCGESTTRPIYCSVECGRLAWHKRQRGEPTCDSFHRGRKRDGTMSVSHVEDALNPASGADSQPDVALNQRGAARFWLRVDRSGGADACWIWTGSKHAAGYGKVKRGGRTLLAHRFAWMLTNGPIPGGLDLLHSCDNPSCCNPRHLRPGTDKENAADRRAHGHTAEGARHWTRTRPERLARGNRNGSRLHPERLVHRPGELSPNHKLTALQVAEIRVRYSAGGISMRLLGMDYGVCAQQVQRIVRGLRWATAG